eukprot:4412639-Amphidinium_carterae.1
MKAAGRMFEGGSVEYCGMLQGCDTRRLCSGNGAAMHAASSCSEWGSVVTLSFACLSIGASPSFAERHACTAPHSHGAIIDIVPQAGSILILQIRSTKTKL